MNKINKFKEKVLNGYEITFEDAKKLYYEDLEELCYYANEIRKYFCKDIFDICTIINAKSGRCSEDCKYCAQSSHYETNCITYDLISKEKIIEEAKRNSERGVLRYSIVTSGKKISDDEVDIICNIAKEINSNIDIKLCGSFGILSKENYEKLYLAGLTRIHNNLETSKEYFPEMCKTHTFEDKLNAIDKASSSGMTICSGGIFGIGETFIDRISLAFELKRIGVKSIPINILNPVKGTPYENNIPLDIDELRRIVAIYRFIIPNAFVRLAGGRGLLADKGKSCFLSGANATISGDMLTTSGITVETDIEMINSLGFKIHL